MHRLDLAYAAADLIVSRAGALTCYEILATGKPSILVARINFLSFYVSLFFSPLMLGFRNRLKNSFSSLVNRYFS